MNLGWYEIIDRIAVIQNSLQDNVYEHQEADVELQKLLDDAQYALDQAYQYAGEQFNNSYEDVKDI